MGWQQTFFMAYMFVVATFCICILIMFFKRRDYQPICAREPWLVISLSSAIIVWTFELCLNRVFIHSWPCLVTLWTGYVGTVIVANIYLMRCITLDAKFNITKQIVKSRRKTVSEREQSYNPRLQKYTATSNLYRQHGRKIQYPTFFTGRSSYIGSFSTENPDRRVERDASVTTTPSTLEVEGVKHRGTGFSSMSSSMINQIYSDYDDESGFKWIWDGFMNRCNRTVLRKGRLVYWSIPSGLILLCSPLYFTLTKPNLRHHTGDMCLVQWGSAATVLTVYAVIYLFGFLIFGFKLYGKFDAFGIKTELKIIGVVGLISAPVWYVLNNVVSFLVFNSNTELSTTLLLILVLFMFLLSTVWPLHKSFTLYTSAKDTLNDVIGAMSTDQGFQAFSEYLETEFSVQHIHFWQDVNILEKKINEANVNFVEFSDIVDFQQTLYTMFIEKDALQEVNIGVRLKQPMRALYEDSCLESWCKCQSDQESSNKLNQILEAYQRAQSDVQKLLRDSFRRFKKSPKFLKSRSMIAEGIVESQILLNKDSLTGQGTAISTNTETTAFSPPQASSVESHPIVRIYQNSASDGKVFL